MFRMSRPNVPAAQFYPAFLNALSVAVRAPTACIWRVSGDSLQMVTHRQFDQSGLRPETEAWSTHQQLLAGIVREKKPGRWKPGEVTPAGTNPLNQELLCIPVATSGGTTFVIEVLSPPSPPNSSPQKKGRLARLEQLCEFFRDYLQSQELRSKAELAEIEQGMRILISRFNAATTSRELAVVAVNEGRQAIGCERVSLGWLTGRHPQILAVSGHDTLDPRSNVVRALSRLTKAATQSGLVLQTRFPKGEDPSPAPALDAAVESAYLSAIDSYPESDRPRQLIVIPIGEESSPATRRGALIIEQFQGSELPNAGVQRAAFVANQIRPAIQRLELLESIPLLSWWSRPGRRPWSRRIWRTLIAVLILSVIGGLASLPMELRLPADGELMAETRHAIFAPENGVIREVHVEHGSRVRAGDALLTLDNLELSAQLRELTGQLVQLRERQRSLEARRSGTRLTEREQIDLQSGLVEVASSLEHAERQIKLLQVRLDRLQVVAPADGVITSWNVKQTLLNRTVLPGDALLQEIEPAGAWVIEVRIPEDRAGYVSRRLTELPEGELLPVEFVLATEPERRFPGRLRRMATRTELTSEGHVVRAVIELDPDNLPPLRDGAEVKARLNCGPERAGFVWFRELIEVIQTYWWY